MINQKTLNLQIAIDNLGDEDVAKMMITESFESASLDSNMQKLHEAMHKRMWNDKESVEFITHTLKGTSATIGAERFSSISSRMNTYLKQKEITYDEELQMGLYGDLQVECKNLKVKISELAQREVDVGYINNNIEDYQNWQLDKQKKSKNNKTHKVCNECCTVF